MMMIKIRRLLRPSIKNLVILLIFIAVCVSLVRKGPHYYWQHVRSPLIEKYSRNKHNFVNPKAACLVPKLNPFSDEVLHLMKYTWDKCTVHKYGRIKDGVFILQGRHYDWVYVEYIRRAPKPNEMTDDFAVSFSQRIRLKSYEGVFKLKLVEDHIKVTISFSNSIHTEYHSWVAQKPDSLKKLTELTRGIPMNIFVQLLDSQSKANFERQAIKTIDYLQNDDDSFIFQSNSVVGDGTTAQLSALLTGVAEEDQYEARRGFPNTTTVDNFSWIFKDFERVGYSTLYTEDDVRYGTFNYRLNGFKYPPTTWYPKPMWIAWAQDYLKKSLCALEQNLDFLKLFNEMFAGGVGKFAFSLTSTAVHDDWNELQVIDDSILDTIKYFKEEGHTMFILFGDHGSRAGEVRDTLQGKMEERLPFMSITMPSFFKTKHPEFYDALRHNTEVLTSYFDFYKTFQHILSYPNLPDKKFRGKSLFTKLPLNRTCEQLGIEEHWCPCLQYKTLSTSDSTVNVVAVGIVDHMNSLISHLSHKGKPCAVMKLLKIYRAGVQTPNEMVQKFKDSKKDERCDSCGVILDDHVETSKSSIKNYEIVLSVSPSGGKFEVNARMDLNGDIKVDPLISRINLYGDQPKCIAAAYPHLRPYCYCV